MKIFLILLFTTLTPFLAFAQNWVSIFDGKSLQGWTKVDPPINVKIEEGMMKLHMTPHTLRHAFIRTNTTYQDFILELEFRRDLTMDSGILFRAENAPDSAFSALFGYQIKIDPQINRNWTGGIMTDFGNGFQWLATLENNLPGLKAEKPSGEWNKLRLEAIGEEISVFLNDIPTAHIRDDKYKAGYFAFKFHYLSKKDDAASLELAIKNIKVITENLNTFKTLNTLPIKDTRGVLAIKYFR
jgi:hypothetical protein